MRTTLAIDDTLLAEAREITDIQEVATLVRMELKALIEREAARRSAMLGGTMPDAWAPSRHRPTDEPDEE